MREMNLSLCGFAAWFAGEFEFLTNGAGSGWGMLTLAGLFFDAVASGLFLPLPFPNKPHMTSE